MGWKDVYYRLTGAQRVRRFTRFGIHYQLPYHDKLGKILLKRGIWEPAQTRLLSAAVRDHQIERFVDVGSYFGYYSGWLIRHAGVREAIAFEANPPSFSALQAQLARNGLQHQVDARWLALSERAGEGQIWQHKAANPGASRLAEGAESARPARFVGSQPVRLSTLDQEVLWRQQTIAIKIDVEGHEAAVLHGAAQLLQHNRVLLQMEVFNHNRAAVLAQMAALGFRLHCWIEDDGFFDNFGARWPDAPE